MEPGLVLSQRKNEHEHREEHVYTCRSGAAVVPQHECLAWRLVSCFPKEKTNMSTGNEHVGQAELDCLGVVVAGVVDQLECCVEDASLEVGFRHHVLF